MLSDLFRREPVRLLAIGAAIMQGLYGQLSGGASLENAAIAALVIALGELQRARVTPA